MKDYFIRFNDICVSTTNNAYLGSIIYFTEFPQIEHRCITPRHANMKRIYRRRATRACLSCRGRKVRCDVTRTSMPCSNCRFNLTECVVPTGPRQPRL
ncbi:Uncharacterized protein HZ326_1820 [Fusarium oxysporum f. sp. albedinis]|nr:Uncharacterized protein HZ326_1820 [Fusarium oxysporum f. sp. albedinis]